MGYSEEAKANTNKSRWCGKCRNFKDIACFRRSNTGYYRCYCRDCDREICKAVRRIGTRANQYHKNDFEKLKQKVDAILGVVCIRCGFNKDIRALTIDHVFDDGNIERKKIKKDRSKLYRLILKNPSRYQRLCANCNQIKLMERYGPRN